LIISGYNLYETYRIKSKVPQEYQESQDILIVLNIIAIAIALILLFGYYFAKESPPTIGRKIDTKGAINLPDTEMPSVQKTINPFSRSCPIDVNKL
jgi:hypothetical protein